MCRKGKFIIRISIYSSEGKALSFPRRTWSSGVLHGLAVVDLCLPQNETTYPYVYTCACLSADSSACITYTYRAKHTHAYTYTHTHLFLPSLTLFCGPVLDLNCLSLCLPWNDLISLSVLEGEIFCI